MLKCIVHCQSNNDKENFVLHTWKLNGTNISKQKKSKGKRSKQTGKQINWKNGTLTSQRRGFDYYRRIYS